MKKRFDSAADSQSAPQEIVGKIRPAHSQQVHASCGAPDVAEIVQNALLHFEGERYRLHAWCIMPNHVHLVVQPLAEHQLKDILHSWKSFTATKINHLLKRDGALWERESFDHLIRRAEHVEHFAQYTEHNPVAAGLTHAPQDWPFSSCGAGFQPAPQEFVDPRKHTLRPTHHPRRTSPPSQRRRNLLHHLEAPRRSRSKEKKHYYKQTTNLLMRAFSLLFPQQPQPGYRRQKDPGEYPASENAGRMPASQFQIPEGIKPEDPFVNILDPATGTATFLVEVIDVIHNTLTQKWKQQGHSKTVQQVLWNKYVPEYLLPRLHGYELMMAPYTIAHMKIGLKLRENWLHSLGIFGSQRPCAHLPH